MPWSSSLVGLCSVLMPPPLCLDIIHKLSVSVALGAVLGSCVLFLTSVRGRRGRGRVGRLAELLKNGVPIEKLLEEGFTIDEMRRCDFPLSELLSGAPTRKEFPTSNNNINKNPPADSNTSVNTEQFIISSNNNNNSNSNRKLASNNNSNGCSTTPQMLSSISTSEARVMLGSLSAVVANSFTLDSTLYRFPIELRRYVHLDGSRLTLIAEDLGSTEGFITTLEYKNKCIERVRKEAERQQTYFKVKCDTTANTIVTTIMELFLSINVGPTPTIIASFFLLHRHIAYNISLQVHADNYSARLADFFHSIQSARIDTTKLTPNNYLQHALRPISGDEIYIINIPLSLIATRPTTGEALILHSRHISSWSGEIITWTPKKSNIEKNDNILILIPDKIFLVSHWNSRGVNNAEIIDEIRQLIATIKVSLMQDSINIMSSNNNNNNNAIKKELPPSYYISDFLKMELPPINRFTTNVCNHISNPFINLFVKSNAKDIFEFEIGIIFANESSDLSLLISPFFTKSVRPQNSNTISGKEIITFIGETENGMVLRIDTVLSTKFGTWFVLKCLYDSNIVLSGELLQYIKSILEKFSLSSPPQRDIDLLHSTSNN